MLRNRYGLPVASGQAAATKYTMVFINNSNNSWNFCCYQKDPGIIDKGSLAAAWFVATVVHPTTTITFEWMIQYGLSWAKSGVINPGIIYHSSQNWDVDASLNTVTLVKLGGSYTFQDLRQQDPAAAFNIVQDDSVVVQDGVGIGISMLITGASSGGDGLNTIYAKKAQPNITEQFVVTPKYWVVFGQTIQPSQILNVTSLTNTVEVPYEEKVFSKVVTLDVQNKWSVGTTADINAMYLREVQRNPDVDWMQLAASESRLVEAQS